jgi:hypothetical protein
LVAPYNAILKDRALNARGSEREREREREGGREWREGAGGRGAIKILFT